MDITTALRALGLGGTPSWDEIRRAHREAIRRAHPDAGGDPARAALLNQALDALHRATAGGTTPLPSPPSEPLPLPRQPASASPDRQMVDRDDPVEVLMRLADAAHDIGDVVFVDPDAGLMEVIVGEAPGVGQLAVHVSPPTVTGEGVPVAFTLDALGVTPAPPIRDVVSGLMSRYRERERR